MTSNLDKVIAQLSFLGLRPEISKYEWRFIIQKTTYLAQVLGITTNYLFTIYVSGPYSKELADDYFQHITKVESLETEYDLTPEDITILERIKACCVIDQNAALMEGTSTTVYIMKQNPQLSDDEVILKLKAIKRHLNDTTLIIGLNKAKELLFKPEYLTPELRMEIERWGNMND